MCLVPVCGIDGRVALRATHGEQVLTYGELRVSDARGRELPAHLEVAKGSGNRASVRLLVDDAAAAYPVSVDPLIASQQAELTAGDGAAYDRFGYSAALSSDGNTALIGAPYKTFSGNDEQGAAYVFVRSGTTWTQQAELTASDGAFGWSVALSSDGNTALIGADNKTVSGNPYQGAAYVFVLLMPTPTPSATSPPTPTPTARPSSFLSSAITATDTCIPVSDTSIFSPTRGFALIGTELISYTGISTSCSGAPAARASGGTAATARVLTGVTRNLNGQGGAHAAGTTVTPTAAPSACVGDCDGNGQVTVDEILTMVNIALGNTLVTSCRAGDANHDNEITVDEILTAVNNALNGCGG